MLLSSCNKVVRVKCLRPIYIPFNFQSVIVSGQSELTKKGGNGCDGIRRSIENMFAFTQKIKWSHGWPDADT